MCSMIIINNSNYDAKSTERIVSISRSVALCTAIHQLRCAEEKKATRPLCQHERPAALSIQRAGIHQRRVIDSIRPYAFQVFILGPVSNCC